MSAPAASLNGLLAAWQAAGGVNNDPSAAAFCAPTTGNFAVEHGGLLGLLRQFLAFVWREHGALPEGEGPNVCAPAGALSMGALVAAGADGLGRWFTGVNCQANLCAPDQIIGTDTNTAAACAAVTLGYAPPATLAGNNTKTYATEAWGRTVAWAWNVLVRGATPPGASPPVRRLLPPAYDIRAAFRLGGASGSNQGAGLPGHLGDFHELAAGGAGGPAGTSAVLYFFAGPGGPGVDTAASAVAAGILNNALVPCLVARNMTCACPTYPRAGASTDMCSSHGVGRPSGFYSQSGVPSIANAPQPGADTCTCDPGWSGADCSTPATPPACTGPGGTTCSGHGSCTGGTGSMHCVCVPGWTGATCESAACPTDSSGAVCGDGRCSGGVCLCNSGQAADPTTGLCAPASGETPTGGGSGGGGGGAAPAHTAAVKAWFRSHGMLVIAIGVVAVVMVGVLAWLLHSVHHAAPLLTQAPPPALWRPAQPAAWQPGVPQP